MLNLSTCWASGPCRSGAELLNRLRTFNLSGIELDYRIRPKVFQGMRESLKKDGPRIASIHNYFPAPLEESGLRPGGDIFRLSQPDKEERRKAVEWTTRTIEHANDLEARAVVLHCGYVDMVSEAEKLHAYYKEGGPAAEEARTFLKNKLAQRDALKPKHLDSLLSSLDQLIQIAQKQNIRLGLENRYDYHELPGLDDFAVIFREFRGAPIGYWHDCGHAHTAELLNVIEPGSLLKRYGEHLIGVHLHDARGLDDHLPPGRGEIDFEALKPHLQETTLLVLELKPGTADSAVAEGLANIRNRLGL